MRAHRIALWLAVGQLACSPGRARTSSSPEPAAPVVVPAPTRETPRAIEPPPTVTVVSPPAAVEPTTPQVDATLIEGPAAPAPASPAQHARLLDSPEDPEPKLRGGIVKELEDVSYIVGNEWSLDAFREVITGLGGGYVGVGPDQAYLMMGWQRPEFAWLIDYDPKVMRVHAMYHALLRHCGSRKEFLAAFEPEATDAIAEVLDDAVADDRVRRLYRNNRDMFRWRLRSIERKLARRRVPSWLTDDETYVFVRELVLGGRVRALRVNLLDDLGMVGIGDAARELGVVVRVVYVSNAEEYWEQYAPQFERNLAALPSDARSLLLRTRLVWQVNRDYVYNAQPLQDFLAWLAAPGVETLEDVVGPKPPAQRDRINFVLTTARPP
ncbi:MAG: hypothetical protein IPK74_31870 [Deltaproteobacteria bacterium]|nr:hypothetical protein [Deltaproteobacteria bacterium]